MRVGLYALALASLLALAWPAPAAEPAYRTYRWMVSVPQQKCGDVTVVNPRGTVAFYEDSGCRILPFMTGKHGNSVWVDCRGGQASDGKPNRLFILPFASSQAHCKEIIHTMLACYGKRDVTCDKQVPFCAGQWDQYPCNPEAK